MLESGEKISDLNVETKVDEDNETKKEAKVDEGLEKENNILNSSPSFCQNNEATDSTTNKMEENRNVSKINLSEVSLNKGKEITVLQNIIIPSPFKRILYWPELKTPKSKKIKKEKIPSVATAKEWQLYHKKKEDMKKKKELEKITRLEERKRKKEEKEKLKAEKAERKGKHLRIYTDHHQSSKTRVQCWILRKETMF